MAANYSAPPSRIATAREAKALECTEGLLRERADSGCRLSPFSGERSVSRLPGCRRPRRRQGEYEPRPQAARVGRRREAESANVALELTPCQRVSDYSLRHPKQ